MSTIQFIERNGRPEYAVVPIDLFERMQRALEDLDDIAALEELRANDDGFRIPGAVADAILDGASPIKAWREHRGLTQDALAAQAGISKAYLCQIETGKRAGTVDTLKAIAAALGLTLDDLQG